MDTLGRLLSRALGGAVIAMVRCYQWTLSPLLGRNCRFTPTCSEYCILAIRKNGPLKGVWQTIGRLMRCHPFSEGGDDPP